MTRYTPSVFTGSSRHMTGGHVTGNDIMNFFRRMFSSDPPPPYSSVVDSSPPPPYPANPYDLPQPIYERLFEIAYLSNKVHCYGRLLVLFRNLRNVQDMNTANTVILNEMNVIRVYLPEFNDDEVSAMFYVLRPFA